MAKPQQFKVSSGGLTDACPVKREAVRMQTAAELFDQTVATSMVARRLRVSRQAVAGYRWAR